MFKHCVVYNMLYAIILDCIHHTVHIYNRLIPILIPYPVQFTPSWGSVRLRASLIPAALVPSYWDASQAKYNDSYIATEPPILRSLSQDSKDKTQDKGVPLPQVPSYDRGSGDGVCWFILEVRIIISVCIYCICHSPLIYLYMSLDVVYLVSGIAH